MWRIQIKVIYNIVFTIIYVLVTSRNDSEVNNILL